MKSFFFQFLFIFYLTISPSIITIHALSTTNKFRLNSQNISKQEESSDELFKKLIGYKDIIKKVTDVNYINSIINNESEEKVELPVSQLENIKKQTNSFSEEIHKLKEKLTSIVNEDNRNAKRVVDHTIDFLMGNKEISAPFNKHKNIISEVYERLLKNGDDKFDFSSFLELKLKDDQSDANTPPPSAYTSDEIMCKSSLDCMLKKLKYQKCSVARVNIRTIYEIVNVIFHIIAKIISLLCACVPIIAGTSISVPCMNTAGIPGLICNIPNMVYKGVFKISVFLYKIYGLISNFCWNPLGP
jgi:hypothetical protein